MSGITNSAHSREGGNPGAACSDFALGPRLRGDERGEIPSSIPLEHRLLLRDEGAVSPFEILGLHTDRLCLRFGAGPVFIPAGEPQFNGGVENFNGWFQEPLFQRRFRRPGDLRRELARLQEAVNTQHVHPRLGGKTPAQHRRGLRLRKLPASFVVPTDRQKLAAGRVIFIRRVSPAGTVSVLSQSYRVGKRHRGLYLRLVIDTGRGTLTAYLNGRVLNRWPYKLRNE